MSCSDPSLASSLGRSSIPSPPPESSTGASDSCSPSATPSLTRPLTYFSTALSTSGRTTPRTHFSALRSTCCSQSSRRLRSQRTRVPIMAKGSGRQIVNTEAFPEKMSGATCASKAGVSACRRPLEFLSGRRRPRRLVGEGVLVSRDLHPSDPAGKRIRHSYTYYRCVCTYTFAFTYIYTVCACVCVSVCFRNRFLAQVPFWALGNPRYFVSLSLVSNKETWQRSFGSPRCSPRDRCSQPQPLEPPRLASTSKIT